MREIVFKGKSVETGEWVMGSYIWGTRPGIRHYIQEDDGYMSPDITEIDPDTLCEFTGMRDRFGHKIFEGDIVKSKNYGDSPDNAYFVSMNNYGWELLLPFYQYYRHRLEIGDETDFEIIGNIWDNPELLDKKE